MGEWVNLDSSMFDSSRYDPDTGILELKYVRGYTYAYYDVPECVYRDFLTADSQGKYANKNITKSYRYEKL